MSKTFGSIFTALRIAPRFHADTSKLDGCIARRMNTGRYDDTVVAKEEVIRFISSCLCKAGAPIENARIVAHHLMTSDYRGHFSHGMNRVAMYVQDIENKVTDPIAKPKTVTDFQVLGPGCCRRRLCAAWARNIRLAEITVTFRRCHGHAIGEFGGCRLNLGERSCACIVAEGI